jgi:hypothetical protein
MRALPFLLCCSLLVLAGCVQTIAVSTMGGLIDEGFSAFKEDDDLAFVEQAIPGNLKLIEAMLKSSPDNERLLRVAAEGYSSYALAFLEDTEPARARAFYLRGRDYALRLLRQNSAMDKALSGTVDDLRRTLEGLGNDDVPAVFWAGFSWGSYVSLNLTDPDAIADLPRAEALMQFVADTDSTFYYGGAHLFLGTLYGSRPRILGGNIDLANRHFAAARAVTGGKFLMVQVFQARSVAVQTQDEAMFDELLSTVESTSLDVLPEFRLGNAIAKKKAGLLKSRKNELF